MRIMSNLDIPCGCDHRKYIMFEKGKLGITEGAILALAVTAIIVARKVNN